MRQETKKETIRRKTDKRTSRRETMSKSKSLTYSSIGVGAASPERPDGNSLGYVGFRKHLIVYGWVRIAVDAEREKNRNG